MSEMIGEIRLLASVDAMFAGFDEMYVLPRNYWNAVSRDVFSQCYTSERIHVDEHLPDGLRNAFLSSNALRYASDGDGLNVVTRDPNDLSRISEKLRTV
jgi:hypothetical protein